VTASTTTPSTTTLPLTSPQSPLNVWDSPGTPPSVLLALTSSCSMTLDPATTVPLTVYPAQSGWTTVTNAMPALSCCSTEPAPLVRSSVPPAKELSPTALPAPKDFST